MNELPEKLRNLSVKERKSCITLVFLEYLLKQV